MASIGQGDRVVGFDRPVIVAEMGVSGDPNYQAR
jgi:hypothetical protein